MEEKLNRSNLWNELGECDCPLNREIMTSQWPKGVDIRFDLQKDFEPFLLHQDSLRKTPTALYQK